MAYVNFNQNKFLKDTEYNCPDFDYVEFDYLELSDWPFEYEKEQPEFILNNEVKIHNHILEMLVLMNSYVTS